MEEFPLFSVIILNYNGKKVLQSCIGSVLKTDYPDFEIVLVDNCSTDGSIEEAEAAFQGLKNLKIIKNPRPLFYAGGNNVGFSHARGKYVVFLNSDTEVDPQWLKELARGFRNEGVGAVSPKVVYYSNPATIDNVGQDLDIFGFGFGRGTNQKDSNRFNEPTEIFSASGVAMAARRDILQRVGVFDDKFIFYYEDTDLSWRIRLSGYKIMVVPRARVYHKVSQTTRRYSAIKELSYNARKNRIATMFRNYAFINLFLFLPVTLLFYFLMYIKELLVDGNRGMANTVIDAIKWNIDNLSDNLAKRHEVQKNIRKVGELEILGKMHKFPLLIRYGI